MSLTIEERIRAYAEEIGIDKIGFTTAEPFEEMRASLIEQKEKGYSSGFEHPVIDERIYPHLIFDQAESIISIALAYPSQIIDPHPVKHQKRRGLFARASWGKDYHLILRERMELLIERMQADFPQARFKAMVDTGELMDVAVARRAGLGFIGRNGLLITEEFGSYVYLGEIITDLKLQQSPQVPFGCGDCDRCIRSCPPKALLGDGRMNAKRCLSYQTQVKDYMAAEFRPLIGNTIYGCDICQMACPYNQGIDYHRHEEMEADPDKVQPDLQAMLDLSNREFRQTFGEMAGSWRGKKPLQRNAIIALANYRDQSALPRLIELMEEDPRPMIRGTAAWAISRIQRDYNPVLIEAMNQQLNKETDPQTIEEMTQALDVLKRKRQPRNKKERR